MQGGWANRGSTILLLCIPLWMTLSNIIVNFDVNSMPSIKSLKRQHIGPYS